MDDGLKQQLSGKLTPGPSTQGLCEEGLQWSQPTASLPLQSGAQRQQHQVRKG